MDNYKIKFGIKKIINFRKWPDNLDKRINKNF